jgi:hypothetical protein
MEMHRLTGMLLLVALASCSKEQAIGAAVTTGVAVAAAAVNRAATKECWGTCTHGYICDPDSGECVPPDELEPPAGPEGEDPEDDGCIEENDGRIVCPNDPETWAPPPDPQPQAQPHEQPRACGGSGGSGGSCQP